MARASRPRSSPGCITPSIEPSRTARRTWAADGRTASRSGPISPPLPAAARVWHMPQVWPKVARGVAGRAGAAACFAAASARPGRLGGACDDRGQRAVGAVLAEHPGGRPEGDHGEQDEGGQRAAHLPYIDRRGPHLRARPPPIGRSPLPPRRGDRAGANARGLWRGGAARKWFSGR